MEDISYYGTVIWFKKTYGFIEWKINNIQQKDIFCHYSDIAASGFKILHKGQQVQFKIGKNNNGDPKAINVEVI